MPLFFLCNLKQQHDHGSTINSDIVYLLMQFTFGITNGHLGSSGMMQSPNYVEPEAKEAAGGFMTLALSVGLATGSILSFGLVYIL
jgi:equilibrative nucleoside transporter 1/2/3